MTMNTEERRSRRREYVREWRKNNPDRERKYRNTTKDRYKNLNAFADWSREHENLSRECSKCGQIKKLKYFRSSLSCKYGKSYDCKECARESTRAWRRNKAAKTAED